MKKMNLKNSENEQTMGLTTLSNDELKNIYGGAKVYFVQTITKEGRIIWALVIK
ncbi:MAG: type A2 lantipeptide [Dysgonamonadaceae bacterium]|jgi:bacteriocin-like protein|nr:type A2 lantipeptide [Dysgonamonadaceae bacterium]